MYVIEQFDREAARWVRADLSPQGTREEIARMVAHVERIYPGGQFRVARADDVKRERRPYRRWRRPKG